MIHFRSKNMTSIPSASILVFTNLEKLPDCLCERCYCLSGSVPQQSQPIFVLFASVQAISVSVLSTVLSNSICPTAI